MRRRRLAGLSMLSVLVAAVWLVAPLAAEDPDPDTRARSIEFQKKALAAREKKDWPAVLENALAASRLRPANPYLLYNVAAAQARNGLAAESAKTLESLIAQTIDFDFEKDEDFAAVRDTAAFSAARKAQ